MNILEELNLQHSINLKSDNKMLLESEAHILNEVSEFGIDNVYINIDDENKNAFPAIFIKKVSSFDSETLQTISNIHRKAWNYNKVLFLYVYSDTEIRIYNCTKTPVIQKKEGLDYLILEGGVGFSGGQRQALLLARLLIRQSNILLLDEPFSHLDKKNTSIAAELIATECTKRNAGFVLTDLDDDDHFNYHRKLNL